MGIPADAFVYGAVSEFVPGQLLTARGQWYLLTDARTNKVHHSLALNGKLQGSLVSLQGHDRVFAISRAFKWRPIVRSVPESEQARPGSLFFGPSGPALRSWFEDRAIYAYDVDGNDITNGFPHDAASVASWSMGLYESSDAMKPVCELFQVSANQTGADDA